MAGPSSPPPRARIPKLDELDLVLVTGRLRLRPLEETDVDALWPFVSDPELPRMMTWAAHTDRSQTLSFVQWSRDALASGSAVTWGIEVDGRLGGLVSLIHIQFAKAALRVDDAELGYWIGPALRGAGYTTEAARAAVQCGFEAIGLHKIRVHCVEDNAASRRVIEKLGFRLVGREEDDVWRDGRWWNMLSYELTSSEWSDVSTTLRVSRPRQP
ncbi:MAG TPA: GNAT family protein [Kofleriaceae bacterium]|nr:GNAT family protein [Kofleriaceae bacterium]HMG57150.1 GNAT family protein [Kofleriaceae bacterium]